MPFASDRQRRYIYAAATRGEAWARKFIKDAGDPVPVVRKRKKLVRHRAGL